MQERQVGQHMTHAVQGAQVAQGYKSRPQNSTARLACPDCAYQQMPNVSQCHGRRPALWTDTHSPAMMGGDERKRVSIGFLTPGSANSEQHLVRALTWTMTASTPAAAMSLTRCSTAASSCSTPMHREEEQVRIGWLQKLQPSHVMRVGDGVRMQQLVVPSRL